MTSVERPLWRAARLDELGRVEPEGFWDEWARTPGYGARWRSVGTELGILGFGMNQYEADEGEELVVPHTEVDYGNQEEAYVLLRGRACFTCDGEQVELGVGEILYVRPEAMREAIALESPTVVLMVGGTPGKPYEPWDYGKDGA
jgi:mannose-6-phosphate isomerase-like protein (cupin superfamily)